ncbi:hypothetical protein BGZ83_000326 [Gryganskiella cystojenkinii]|nr:hypothetical protein BGZ83_000326 [Gryganskiella cystojenkinii]
MSGSVSLHRVMTMPEFVDPIGSYLEPQHVCKALLVCKLFKSAFLPYRWKTLSSRPPSLSNQNIVGSFFPQHPNDAVVRAFQRHGPLFTRRVILQSGQHDALADLFMEFANHFCALTDITVQGWNLDSRPVHLGRMHWDNNLEDNYDYTQSDASDWRQFINSTRPPPLLCASQRSLQYYENGRLCQSDRPWTLPLPKDTLDDEQVLSQLRDLSHSYLDLVLCLGEWSVRSLQRICLEGLMTEWVSKNPGVKDVALPVRFSHRLMKVLELSDNLEVLQLGEWPVVDVLNVILHLPKRIRDLSLKIGVPSQDFVALLPSLNPPQPLFPFTTPDIPIVHLSEEQKQKHDLAATTRIEKAWEVYQTKLWQYEMEEQQEQDAFLDAYEDEHRNNKYEDGQEDPTSFSSSSTTTPTTTTPQPLAFPKVRSRFENMKDKHCLTRLRFSWKEQTSSLYPMWILSELLGHCPNLESLKVPTIPSDHLIEFTAVLHKMMYRAGTPLVAQKRSLQDLDLGQLSIRELQVKYVLENLRPPSTSTINDASSTLASVALASTPASILRRGIMLADPTGKENEGLRSITLGNYAFKNLGVCNPLVMWHSATLERICVTAGCKIRILTLLETCPRLKILLAMEPPRSPLKEDEGSQLSRVDWIQFLESGHHERCIKDDDDDDDNDAAVLTSQAGGRALEVDGFVADDDGDNVDLFEEEEDVPQQAEGIAPAAAFTSRLPVPSTSSRLSRLAMSALMEQTQQTAYEVDLESTLEPLPTKISSLGDDCLWPSFRTLRSLSIQLYIQFKDLEDRSARRVNLLDRSRAPQMRLDHVTEYMEQIYKRLGLLQGLEDMTVGSNAVLARRDPWAEKRTSPAQACSFVQERTPLHVRIDIPRNVGRGSQAYIEQVQGPGRQEFRLGLEFSLVQGLDHLKGMRRLRRVNLFGLMSTRGRIGWEAYEWMSVHWPNLEVILGRVERRPKKIHG